MKCDVCENEIKGGTEYRVLTLSYVTERAPKKRNPHRTEYVGAIMGTHDIYFSQGYNTYVDTAKICVDCQERLDKALDQVKVIFHPCKESVIDE